jgi:hypothetical protein
MKASRDRARKRAGQKAQPKKITDSELALQVAEFCRLMRQRNKELSALLEQQQRVLLARLPAGLPQ